MTKPVTIVLSSPPPPGAPLPVLWPAVPGHWSRHGRTLTFTPASGYAPWATEHLLIPGTLATPEEPEAVLVPGTLATAQETSFGVAGVPLLRAQQLLAELHYLPVSFGPAPGLPGLDSEPRTAASVPASPQPGTFSWRFPDIPASLSSLWSLGQDNVVTEGALMHFEAQESLAVDGVLGPQVWRALTAAVATRSFDPVPYDYMTVSEALPEQLAVWRDGQDVYQTPVNTGVPGANTPTGTWPVYERFQLTTMIGTDVDGSHYDVPDVPWVAYFYGGDAVHGYWRSSYGYPQSNGCVELPVANAQLVWSMDPTGTLVTVTS